MVQNILQLAVSGIAMGFIYALVALEYTLIWNATGLLNFSHDKFIMLSAYIFAGTFILQMGLNPIIGTILSLTVMFIFGAIVAIGVFNPLRNMSSPIYAVVGTIVLARILTEFVRLVWGPAPFSVPNFLSGRYRIGGVVIARANVWIIVISILTLVLLQVFFKTTKAGKAMRCVSQNKVAASLMGIDVTKNIILTIGLSAMICSLIGILVIPLFNIDTSMSNMIGLKGFAAGVVGGFGYLPGAIVGGLIIGLLENISVMVFPAVYKDCIAFILLILFLLVKPTGILGHRK